MKRPDRQIENSWLANDRGINWTQRGAWPAYWLKWGGETPEDTISFYRLEFISSEQEVLDFLVSGDNRYKLFLDGKTAMMMTYLNRADTFYEVVDNDDFFGILPIPKAPGAESYVCTQNWFMPYCVFNNIENPEGAVEFCSIFFRPPYAKSSDESIMLMQAELSTRLRDQASVDFAIESLDYVYPSKMMLYNRTTDKYMWGATDAFIKGENTPAIYFASVRDAVNNEIDKFRSNSDS